MEAYYMKVIGRKLRQIGDIRIPNKHERKWLRDMCRKSHEEANRDWEKWIVEGIK